MKRVFTTTLMVLSTVVSTKGFAGCQCADWVERGGYCVDYVKSRIPSFPVPADVVAIKKLDNKHNKHIAVGDVAIFDLNRYWHVGYVEKVHLDQHGKAAAINVSEMNFGEQITLEDLKDKWGLTKKKDLKQAACCGVTNKYGEVTLRENIELSSIQQVWSPKSSLLQLLSRLLTPMGINL